MTTGWFDPDPDPAAPEDAKDLGTLDPHEVEEDPEEHIGEEVDDPWAG